MRVTISLNNAYLQMSQSGIVPLRVSNAFDALREMGGGAVPPTPGRLSLQKGTSSETRSGMNVRSMHLA